jgi:hypothetical protein
LKSVYPSWNQNCEEVIKKGDNNMDFTLSKEQLLIQKMARELRKKYWLLLPSRWTEKTKSRKKSWKR